MRSCVWVAVGKKRLTEQDELIRLAILFRVAPSKVDEVLTSREAADILEYLSVYPMVEDVVDIQLARIMQMFSSGTRIENLILRKRDKTEEEIAEDWIRWIDERKNRTAN